MSCPTWFLFNNSTQQCECGTLKPWGIRCDQQEMKVEVASGYCVSYLHGRYYAGGCSYAHSVNSTDRVFTVVPNEPDKLDEAMCGSYDRKGLLCGRCIDGYGPAVYSLDQRCADCSKLSVGLAVSLYVLLEVISLLLFFIFVMIFRVNITAGPLLGYVFFCQLFILDLQTKRTFVLSYFLSHSSPFVRLLIYASLALCGVWSFKLSWIVIPPFCISSQLTGIHIQLLELVPPIMTIIILVLTCILIEFHRRNCTPVVRAWKVIERCLAKLKLKPLNGNAVIHAFATFIFLSAYNLNYVAIVMLTHDPVSHADGTFYRELVDCDPTITWMSNKHIAYLTFMITAFVLLVLLPSFILCVYPTRIYSFMSRIISSRKQLAIKTFVEALHPSFKDGLNGTKDYRVLAGVSLIYRALFSLLSFYVWNLTKSGYNYQFATGIMLVLLSLMFAYWRPCRSLMSNISISYHGMVQGFLCMALSFWGNEMEILRYMFIIFPIISHIFVLTWTGSLVVKKMLQHWRIM